jgi:hypothetical protein
VIRRPLLPLQYWRKACPRRHTACLYINKLRVVGVLKGPVNAYFESIFEIGVDEMLWDDMNKNDEDVFLIGFTTMSH